MSALSLPRLAAPRRPGRAAGWLLGAAGLGAAIGVAVAAGQTKVALGLLLVPALIALIAHPDWLPVLLLATAFGEAVSTGSVTLSRLAAPLAVLVMIVALPGRRRLRLPELNVLWAVLAYSLWAIASAMWTVNQDSSFSQGGTGYAVASLGLSVVFMLAVAMFVQTERDLHRLLVTVSICSALTGLVSIEQYVSGASRTVGLAGDANFFAAIQVASVPLQAILATRVQRGSTRLLVLGGLAVTVGSVVTSLSRGGLLALGAVFVLLMFQPARAFFRTPARKRAFILATAVGMAVLLAASYSALSARTSSLFTTGDGGSGRTNLWRAAITGWHEHPVTGMGFGAFIGQSNALLLRTPGVDFSAYALRPGGQFVHNAYLESLVELGVVGAALFLGVLTAMALALRRTARRAAAAGAPFVAAVSRALLLSVAGFAFASIFLSTETNRALWILIGLSLALPRVLLKASSERTITELPAFVAPRRPALVAAGSPDTDLERKPNG
jgi:O-antigen ligase